MNGYTPAEDWQMNPVEVPSEARAFNVRDLLGIFVRRWPIVCGVPFLAVLVGDDDFHLTDTTLHQHGCDPD